jgi:hypothetical protein
MHRRSSAENQAGKAQNCDRAHPDEFTPTFADINANNSIVILKELLAEGNP